MAEYWLCGLMLICKLGFYANLLLATVSEFKEHQTTIVQGGCLALMLYYTSTGFCAISELVLRLPFPFLTILLCYIIFSKF